MQLIGTPTTILQMEHLLLVQIIYLMYGVIMELVQMFTVNFGQDSVVLLDNGQVVQ